MGAETLPEIPSDLKKQGRMRFSMSQLIDPSPKTYDALLAAIRDCRSQTHNIERYHLVLPELLPNHKKPSRPFLVAGDDRLQLFP